VTAEPLAPARCWELDAGALARCTRLTRAQRLILGAELAEGARQAAELLELLGDIARARAASERQPPPRPRLVPARGVAGDLDAALAEIGDRKSKLREIAGGRR
jgi:hypothetical protein